LLAAILLLVPLIVAAGGATRFWIRWAVAFALGPLIWLLGWFLVTSMPVPRLGAGWWAAAPRAGGRSAPAAGLGLAKTCCCISRLPPSGSVWAGSWRPAAPGAR